MVNYPFGPQRAGAVRGVYKPTDGVLKNVLGAVSLVALVVLLFAGWTMSDRHGGGWPLNLLAALLWFAGVCLVAHLCGWWRRLLDL